MRDNEELMLILAKDGREWTPAESRLMTKYMNNHGRAALKVVRKELRELLAEHE